MPESSSALAASAVSQVGETQGWKKSWSPSSMTKSSIAWMPLATAGMIVGVPEHAQRHHRVDHRRLDAAPPAVDVLVREDPVGGLAERALAERLHGRLAEQLEHPVEGQEEVAPA